MAQGPQLLRRSNFKVIRLMKFSPGYLAGDEHLNVPVYCSMQAETIKILQRENGINYIYTELIQNGRGDKANIKMSLESTHLFNFYNVYKT